MLTAKKEAFAQAIVFGIDGNPVSQADAYRHAYDAENMSDKVIYNEASALMNDHDVTVRIEELKKELAARSAWTREKSVAALERALMMAEGNAKPTEVTAVIKELNAMHGFNAPSKVAFTDTDGKDLKPPVFNNAFVTNDTDRE